MISEQYMKLNHRQLSTIIKDSSLRIMSEYILFELVLRWINHDKTVRQEFTSQLMENIRLPLLSGEELVEKVQVHFIHF